MTRTHKKILAVLGCLAATALLGAAASGTLKPTSLFTPDKGNFKIMVSGQPAGKEEFELSPNGGDWIVKGNSEIQSIDGVTHVSGTLQLHADGTPASYEWSTQGAKKASSTVTFAGPVATIELRLEGRRPFTQQFTFNSPQIVVLDNNLYYQYAVLAGLYDREKKGVQTFSVLVPQALTPGSVTVESLGEQNSNSGKKLEELVVKTADLEVDLFLDGARLVRIVAPSSNAEIVRQ
jgi:hypothetical protein